MKDDFYPEFGVDSSNYERRMNSNEKKHRVKNVSEKEMAF